MFVPVKSFDLLLDYMKLNFAHVEFWHLFYANDYLIISRVWIADFHLLANTNLQTS